MGLFLQCPSANRCEGGSRRRNGEKEEIKKKLKRLRDQGRVSGIYYLKILK